MLHLGTDGSRTKVNVLKKVKVNGQWKLCPVIAEASSKIECRSTARPEVHNEGVYYIEWRKHGQRLLSCWRADSPTRGYLRATGRRH